MLARRDVGRQGVILVGLGAWQCSSVKHHVYFSFSLASDVVKTCELNAHVFIGKHLVRHVQSEENAAVAYR